MPDELHQHQFESEFPNQEFSTVANTDLPLKPAPYSEAGDGPFHQWYEDLDAASQSEQKSEGSQCDPQSKLQAEQIQAALTNSNAPPATIQS